MTLLAGPVLRDPDHRVQPYRPHPLSSGWPLLATIGGYGIVWLLGLRLFVWPLVACALAWWLYTQRGRVRAPVGFGLWLCFLWWSAMSVLTVTSAERLAAWAYRESLYVSAAVILLYLVTATTRELPTRRLATAILWLFGTSVVLGMIGLMVPDVTFSTVTQSLLPRSLSGSQFIVEQVEARVSATAEFLEEVRPVGPYGYTNEWGAAMGMLWPLAVFSVPWLRSPRMRLTAWLLIASAIVPAVLSVNRGLWISAAVAVAVVLFRSALSMRLTTVAATVAGAAIVAAAVWFSPLRETLIGRLQRPNLGTRQTLAADALAKVRESPWFGYGAPQEATFAADTNDVSVGTHGQVFTLLVSHGLPGTFFYLAFIVSALVVTWRVGHRAVWAWAAIVVLLVQSAFYTGAPVPLVLGCVAYACCLRDVAGGADARPPDLHRARRGGAPPVSHTDDLEVTRQTVDAGRLGRAIRQRIWIVLLLAATGAAIGYQVLPSATYRSTASVEVRDGYVDPSEPSALGRTNMVTEQQVAQSSSVIARAVRQVDFGVDDNDFDAQGEVTSPPDSTTLVFSFSAPSADEAREVVEAWAASYLRERGDGLGEDLEAARNSALVRVNDLQQDLAEARQLQQSLPAGNADRQSAEIAVANVTSQLASARRTVSRLQGLDVDAGRSLGAATSPGDPSGLTPAIGAMLGGLIGMLLGAVLALILHRIDRRLRGRTPVAGVPVWSDDTGSTRGSHWLDGVAARLGLMSRQPGTRTVLLASMSGTEDDVAGPLSDALQRLGVETTVGARVEDLMTAAPTLSEPGHGDGSRKPVATLGTGLTLIKASAVMLEERIAVLGSQADVTLLVVDPTIVYRADVEREVTRMRQYGGSVEGLLISSGADVSGLGQWWRRRRWRRAHVG